jgi:hypothetical protein
LNATLEYKVLYLTSIHHISISSATPGLSPQQLLYFDAPQTFDSSGTTASIQYKSEMPHFTYDDFKLPSLSPYIRLIDLYSSHVESTEAIGAIHFSPPLRCRIHSEPLELLRSYTALSYTWGPPDQTHSIVVSDYKFFITLSLAAALHHIRHPSDVITLWIDQICINQEDGDEKNAQVPLMTQIYRQAEEVLIWIGPAALGSDCLMDVWHQVGLRAKAWGMDRYHEKEHFQEFQKIITKSNSTD